MAIEIKLTGEITGLEETIAKLREENYKIRENSVSHEVYAEAVKDKIRYKNTLKLALKAMEERACQDCKYCTFVARPLHCPYCDTYNNLWEWKHLDEIKEILGI